MVEWLAAPEYWHARWLFQRGLGLIYLVAFLAAAAQFLPLLGEDGILPVPRFVDRAPWRRAPSLFQWRYSDRLARVVIWLGAALSVAALAGLTEAGPIWVSMFAWLVLWGLYLSIVNVGQIWYAFGWESLLLEAGFLAVFLGPHDVAPPVTVVWLLRWLLFRVEFGAGLIKMRGDRCWRDLTCLEYHHETQPLPNPLSWWFHHLPRWAHRVEVGANHLTQLVVPFLLFAPQPVASVAGTIVVVTQGYLMLSGNFSWLNATTLLLGLTALSNSFLDDVLPVSPPGNLGDPPLWFAILVLALTAMVVVRSIPVVRNLLSSRQAMNRSFDPLRLVNTYGAFGSITRTRYEIEVEATLDERPGPDADWRPYRFKGKPGDPSQRPPQVAPYHLRLDWLMWFAAMAPRPSGHPWFSPFLAKLLDADPGVLRLLRHDPFDGEPPRYVRARRYRYRFTTPAERRQSGDWWHRELVGEYVPAVSRRVG